MSSEKRHGKLSAQELGIVECGGVMEDKLGEQGEIYHRPSSELCGRI